MSVSTSPAGAGDRVATFKSFGAFGAQLDKMAAEIEHSARAKITRDMAQKAQKIADSVASGDLGGDLKFTHWAPKWDTQIKPLRDGASILMPTRSGAGVITVANQGRNQGNAGGFSGPGIGKSGLTSRTKSGGLRKVRSFKAKRWNGTTKGMHTADKAIKVMEAQLPKIAEDGIRKVMQRHFDVT